MTNLILAPLLLVAGTDPSVDAQQMLEAWAPVVVQHVADEDAGRDRPTRIDFDGDWVMGNNWVNQTELGDTPAAYAYGAAVLTESHAFLTYHFFYPRDWERPICLPLICHENDLESVLFVVEREADGSTGSLLFAETKTHRRYLAVPGERVLRDPRGRPRLRAEAFGHGLRACEAADLDCVPGPNRIVYQPGVAQRPPSKPKGERVDYELLSLYDTYWQHRGEADGEGALAYAGVSVGRLGSPFGIFMPTSFMVSGARPPWGLRSPGSERGDWFLDPAAAAQRRGLIPETASGAYLYNPFLTDLRRECEGVLCRAAEAISRRGP